MDAPNKMKDTLELQAEMVDACVKRIWHDDKCLIRAIGNIFLIAKIVHDNSGVIMETPYDLDDIAKRAQNGYKLGCSEMMVQFIPGEFGETDLETSCGFTNGDKYTKTYIEVLYRYPRFLIEQQHIQIGTAESQTSYSNGITPILYNTNRELVVTRNDSKINWLTSNAFDTLNMIGLSTYSNFKETPDLLYKSFYENQIQKRDKIFEKLEKDEQHEIKKQIEFLKEVLKKTKYISTKKIEMIIEQYKKSLAQ